MITIIQSLSHHLSNHFYFCQVVILQLRSTCVNLAMSHDQGVAVCPTARSALAVHEKSRTLRQLSGLVRISIVANVNGQCTFDQDRSHMENLSDLVIRHIIP